MNLHAFSSVLQNGFQQAHRFKCFVWLPTHVESRIINADERARAAARGGAPRTGGVFTNDNIAQLNQRAGTDQNGGIIQAIGWLNQGLLCESAALPDRSMDTVPLTLYGVTEQIPLKTDYTSLTCSFLVPNLPAEEAGMSRGNPLAMFFSQWQNVIQDFSNGAGIGVNLPLGTRNMSFPSEYYATMKIIAYDRNDNPVITYRFDRAYPTAVEAVALSWGNIDYALLPVRFNFSMWSIE
jgi:hypothetical protein